MYLEWRRSWSSCRWPERAIFTTNGVSDHLETTNYFIGNVVDHFGASTSISLAGTKNMVRYREDVGLNKYKALFTQPRPSTDAQIKYPSYLNFGNLVTVFILLALLRVFASLVSKFKISLFKKSNLCEEGFSVSNCLIIADEFLIDLISLISSIASLRQIKRRAVDAGSI